MLTNTQGHIARIHPIEGAAISCSTEANHPHRLASRGICLSIRQTERHPRITGAPVASIDSTAETPATHSASPAEPVRRMAARHCETRPAPSYRDDHASRLAVASVTRLHTRRGPPAADAQARSEDGKGQKKRERGLTANQAPLTH